MLFEFLVGYIYILVTLTIFYSYCYIEILAKNTIPNWEKLKSLVELSGQKSKKFPVAFHKIMTY